MFRLMSATEAPKIPPFNPMDPDYVADPYPLQHRMRAAEPLHYSPVMQGHVLTRYHDIKRALTHPDLDILPGRGGDSPLHQMMGDWLSHHPHLRPVMLRAFTPRIIQQLRPRIQEIVDGLLDEVLRAPQAELISSFAHPVPLIVIAEMLGVPEADRRSFKQWALAIERGIDGAFMGRVDAEADEATVALLDYFGRLAAERRKAPGDDLISRLLEAEKDEGIRITERQLVANCVLFFFAGHESTANQIGSGIYWLLKHPDQLAALRADPSLWPNAVEEVLRYEPAVQLVGRICLADAEVAGRTLKKGERLSLLLSAANRDPEVFPDPDRFDVRRSFEAQPQLAFSWGRHLCLGIHLARAEAHIALQSLFDRAPDLRLEDQKVVWKKHFAMRGPLELHVSRGG